TLRCYTCRELTTIDNCTTIQNCAKNETICKTTTYSSEDVYPYTGIAVVTRMCSSTCVPSNVDGIGMTRPVYCCYSDLCNIDGATSL
ncbi:LYPD2 protein, partial [Rhinopomastus cyanomelas]|nr:LYPD2 protein [Rhinopomastus cyanomelas]